MPKYTFNPDLAVPPEGEPGDVPAWPVVTVEIDGERVIQTEHGTFVAFDGEPGTHEEMLEATEGWKDVTPLEEPGDDLETLARAAESNMGLESGVISATDDFRTLLKDPVALEALMAEAVEQVRGPLHYDGDVALAVMGQIVGPDARGEALVPVEATYSLETNLTEVWYRVAVEADVEAHVAAVGRSAA